MRAKCYLCGNEVDEFAIIETNPEISLCFDCEDKFIQDGIGSENIKEILEGGETHGNKGQNNFDPCNNGRI